MLSRLQDIDVRLLARRREHVKTNQSIRPLFHRCANRMTIVAGALFLASLPAMANTVTFDGTQFQSFYGSEVLTFDGGGNLLVPVVLSGFGAAGTTLPSGASFAATSFLDSGSSSGPAGELWVQDFTNGHLDEAAVGAFTGQSDFYMMYRIDGTALSQFLDTGIARTPGVHSVALALLPNGTLDFFVDGSLAGSATAAQYGIPQFADALLTVNGPANGNVATFTSFSTVPEPSYLVCLAGLLGGFGFARKRFSRSA